MNYLSKTPKIEDHISPWKKDCYGLEKRNIPGSPTPQQQALIRVALCTNMGGIHAFTTIIGRCITLSRVMYYKVPGRTFPDNTRCICPAVPEGKACPGAELILTPPATSKPVLIDEGMVNNILSEYKSHFPKEVFKQKAAQ